MRIGIADPDYTVCHEKPLFSRKEIFSLIWPLVIERFLSMTVGLVDTIMISSCGEAAVSGVALVDNINNLIIALLLAMCTGGAVVVSQFIGRGDHENARACSSQLIYVSVGFILLITLFLFFFCNAILDFLFPGIENDVMAFCRTYLKVSSVSFPFLALYHTCAALYRARGNSRISMRTSLLMNILNVLGNYYLIYSCQLEVFGAALATVISRIVSSLLLFALMQRNSSAERVEGLYRIHFRPALIRPLLRVGIPSGIEGSMFEIGKLAVQRILSYAGTTALAAYVVVSNCNEIIITGGKAVAAAMVPIIGVCIGAADYKQARKFTWQLIIVVHVIMIVISIPFLTIPDKIIGLMNLTENGTNQVLAMLPMLCICDILIWPYSFAFPSMLRASGDAPFTMWTSVITMWICRIGFSFIFVRYFNLGTRGVWYSMYIDWVFRSAAFLLRYASGKWKLKHVLDV